MQRTGLCARPISTTHCVSTTNYIARQSITLTLRPTIAHRSAVTIARTQSVVGPIRGLPTVRGFSHAIAPFSATAAIVWRRHNAYLPSSLSASVLYHSQPEVVLTEDLGTQLAVQAAIEEEEKLARQKKRWGELIAIGQVIIGAVLGYFTARLLREAGRYIVLFYGAEAIMLMLLTGSQVMTQEQSLNVLKYTFPPMQWLVSGLKRVVTGQFTTAYRMDSVAFQASFLASFGYTLYAGGLFYGQAIGAWRRGYFL